MYSGKKLNIKKPNGSYFLTMTIVEWVDLFTRENHKKILINTLRFYIKNKGLHVYAYCIMSNHIHLIANCEDQFSLSDIIRDFKKYTSKALIQEIQNEPESRRDWMLRIFREAGENHSKQIQFKVWQDSNHAIELFTPKFTWQKVNYIHQNPVRAGWVREIHHYNYSSASNYMEMESVLEEVDRLIPYLQTV